jgi:hypothetical protein
MSFSAGWWHLARHVMLMHSCTQQQQQHALSLTTRAQHNLFPAAGGGETLPGKQCSGFPASTQASMLQGTCRKQQAITEAYSTARNVGSWRSLLVLSLDAPAFLQARKAACCMTLHTAGSPTAAGHRRAPNRVCLCACTLLLLYAELTQSCKQEQQVRAQGKAAQQLDCMQSGLQSLTMSIRPLGVVTVVCGYVDNCRQSSNRSN